MAKKTYFLKYVWYCVPWWTNVHRDRYEVVIKPIWKKSKSNLWIEWISQQTFFYRRSSFQTINDIYYCTSKKNVKTANPNARVAKNQTCRHWIQNIKFMGLHFKHICVTWSEKSGMMWFRMFEIFTFVLLVLRISFCDYFRLKTNLIQNRSLWNDWISVCHQWILIFPTFSI